MDSHTQHLESGTEQSERDFYATKVFKRVATSAFVLTLALTIISGANLIYSTIGAPSHFSSLTIGLLSLALTTLMGWMYTATRKHQKGEWTAEVAIFDTNEIGFDDVKIGSNGAAHKSSPTESLRPNSIMGLAKSISFAAANVDKIADSLTESLDSFNSPETQGSKSASDLLDSQANLLTEIDHASSQVEHINRMGAQLVSSFGEIIEITDSNRTQITSHIRSLEMLSDEAVRLLTKSTEASRAIRFREREKAILSNCISGTTVAVKTVRQQLENSLLYFHDNISNMESLDQRLPPKLGSVRQFGDEVTQDHQREETEAGQIAQLLDQAADALQLVRINHNLYAAGSKSQTPLENEHLAAGEIAGGIEEADSLLREARELTLKVLTSIRQNRQKFTIQTTKIQREFETIHSQSTKNYELTVQLEKLIGNLGHQLGQTRTAIIAEQNRLEATLKQLDTDPANDDASEIMQQLTLNLTRVSQTTSRIAIDGNRIERDCARVNAKMSDLRSLAEGMQQDLPGLQRLTYSVASNSEKLVTLIQKSVTNHHSKAGDKPSAKTTRAEIKRHLTAIEQCAQKMIAFEHRTKKVIGPSPAIDSKAVMSSAPDLEFPLQ